VSLSRKGIRHSATKGCLPELLRGERQGKIGKGEDAYMTEKSFMMVDEVAAELRVSKSKAYQIVRELNVELQKKGYLTVMGRVNTTFFHKKVRFSE